MPTVVTPETMIDVINHKPIPEFKAPDAKAAPAVNGSADGATEKSTPPKDVNSGRFVSPTGEKTEARSDATGGEPATDAAGAKDAAEGDDGDDADTKDLPERVRKAIGKKHRMMKESEEFAERQYNRARTAEQRADDLARENAELKAKGQPAKPADDAEAPKAENFKTVGEYADALVNYRVGKALRERDAEAQQRHVDQSIERVKAEFGKRVAKAAESIPDYHEVVGDADVDVPSHVAQHIVESDVGPELGYHLAKHPEELERIKKLSPIRAIAELGKLEDKLAKPAAKTDDAKSGAAKSNGASPASGEPKQISKAPAPIDTLNSQGSSPVEKDPAKMTFKELREYEIKRFREARARR